MSLPPGMRLGPYEIVAPLGAGGMGEVYRARDTQLKREVALKVLPAAFTSDADRLARFQREAELLATLNHPHIAAIYGLERTEATTALVLELVEGQTLADRIARGPIPLDEAVPIARQIADALESAHDRGIIHRDLKPANVKVRPDGTVKVLDFGLAKALDEEGAEPPRSQGASLSPTMTSPAMTRLGIILGTAAYMSPEQARGRPADRRSDIWAFGCVLYEMLTGRSIFGGDEVSDTLAAVLRAEPDWNALPADTPPPIRRLLERCLRKDPRQRLPHIGAARLELDDTDLGGASAGQQATPPRPRLAWGVAAGALVLAAALTIPASRYFQRQAMVALPQYRLDVSTPSTEDLTSFAISPDGLRLVFSAAAGGRQQLWLRDLGQSTSRPLPGTDGGRLPFWSPSSRSIGFFTGSGLYRLDLDGGTPRFLAPISAGLGGSWGVDDVIVFAPGTALPLQRVSASGGGATKAVEFADGINGHRFPHFLPGTRSFLVHGRGARTGVLLATLDSQQATWLTEADAGGLFVPETPSGTGDQLSNGWVLFVRGRALVARRFDRDARALIGDAVTLADNVGTTPGPTFGAAASVSVSGVVAYRSADRAPRQLQWFDRSGKPLAAVGPADATLANPELSPDGRIAVERFRDNNTDIWILDGDRAPRRLTDNDARDYFPVWADNHTLFFASTRENGFGVYQRRADGTGSESQLFKSDRAFVPIDVSPDKSALLYFQENAATGPDIGIRLLTDAPGTPQDSTIIGKKFREMWAQFSPRGDWIAYQSEESNEFEIYITPYRSRGGVTPVSVNGGIAARWAVDGEELYYIAPDGTIMVVDVPARGSGSDFGAPRRLFQPNIVGGGSAVVGLRQQYDVDARGRFLVNTNVNAAVAQTPPITLLLNADAFRRTP